MLTPLAVLTDIEGTTTPATFVQGVLLPFARAALPDWTARIDLPEVASVLAEVGRMVPDQAALTTLQHWSDRDLKLAPLQQLQGMIWEQGYADGALRGEVFADVAPHLRAWAAGGVRVFTFTSGSIQAQRLIFGHSTDGDLSGLIAGFFDTRIGAKRDPDTYVRLAIAMNVPTAAVAFLSDTEAELDAATTAGMRTCHVVRAGTGAARSSRHPVVADFAAAAAVLGLPRA
ncbi:MAG: acireductone synthase [Acetobacteraceae bacterium]|nr:acireductone synthase [Acetobacteraceae bacterium]